MKTTLLYIFSWIFLLTIIERYAEQLGAINIILLLLMMVLLMIERLESILTS